MMTFRTKLATTPHDHDAPALGFPTVHELGAGQLSQIIGGELRLADVPPLDGDLAPVGRIVTDRAEVRPGDVFWAVQSNGHDTADYAHEAWMRGAEGIVSQRPLEPWSGRWSVQTPQSTLALWELARWHRARQLATRVAVTGSIGKTVTACMIHAVLNQRFTGTCETELPDLDLSLPLAMLAVHPLDDFAVLELPDDSPAKTEPLWKLCGPRIGVLTGLDDSGSTNHASRVQWAKSQLDLLHDLPVDGVAILPGDDPWARRFAKRCAARIVWFGRSGDCDVCPESIECQGGWLRFELDGARFRVPAWGRHWLPSALAAYAVGRAFELSTTEIAAGLAQFQPPPRRCQVLEAGRVTIIDDTWNNRPASARAALAMLRNFAAVGRRVVVAGDLPGGRGQGSGVRGQEDNEALVELHEQLGEQVVAVCGADLLVACGEHAPHVVHGARQAGLCRQKILTCRRESEVANLLATHADAGDVILLQGSQVPAGEKLASHLRTSRSARIA